MKTSNYSNSAETNFRAGWASATITVVNSTSLTIQCLCIYDDVIELSRRCTRSNVAMSNEKGIHIFDPIVRTSAIVKQSDIHRSVDQPIVVLPVINWDHPFRTCLVIKTPPDTDLTENGRDGF
ncbi:hypothetical protein [Absidia glauca]|uniref:Uncharacterized protein n=1 Tax=Absidia glauca TaxID=4829 RepID=A0A168NE95_ABSGL|nr:hypothetical protein [Absidia glauca]